MDLDFVRDAVVELFGVEDDKVETHFIVKKFKKNQEQNSVDEEKTLAGILVIGIISELLNIEHSKITPSAKFREDLWADSLDLFELVMAFEEITGSEITDEQAMQIITVEKAVELVASELKANLQGK